MIKLLNIRKYSSRPQNAVEKIVQRFAIDQTDLVKQGDFVAIRPHRVMTHDNTGPVITK